MKKFLIKFFLVLILIVLVLDAVVYNVGLTDLRDYLIFLGLIYIVSIYLKYKIKRTMLAELIEDFESTGENNQFVSWRYLESYDSVSNRKNNEEGHLDKFNNALIKLWKKGYIEAHLTGKAHYKNMFTPGKAYYKRKREMGDDFNFLICRREMIFFKAWHAPHQKLALVRPHNVKYTYSSKLVDILNSIDFPENMSYEKKAALLLSRPVFLLKRQYAKKTSSTEKIQNEKMTILEDNKLFGMDLNKLNRNKEEEIKKYKKINKNGVRKESLQHRNYNYTESGILIEGQVTDTKRVDENDYRSELYELTVKDHLGNEKQEYTFSVKKNHSASLVQVRDFVRIYGMEDTNSVKNKKDYIIIGMEYVNMNNDRLTPLFDVEGSLEEAHSLIKEIDKEDAFLLQGPITKAFRTFDTFSELVQLEIYDRLSNQNFIVDVAQPFAHERLKVGDDIRVEGIIHDESDYEPFNDIINEKIGRHFRSLSISKLPKKRNNPDKVYGISYTHDKKHQYRDYDCLVEGKISKIRKSEIHSGVTILKIWAHFIQKGPFQVVRKKEITLNMKDDTYMPNDIHAGDLIRLCANEEEDQKWIKKIWKLKKTPSAFTDFHDELPPIQKALQTIQGNEFIFEGPITEIIRTKDIFAEIIYIEIFDRVTDQDYFVELNKSISSTIMSINLDEEVRINGYIFEDEYSAHYLDRVPLD